jgi:3-oxoacyl-[acyl-carrier-protein] synthase-3
MQYAKIIGTGSYLPVATLSNADLEKMVDTSDEWIMKRVGVKSRHVIGDSKDTTGSMALSAAKRAIEAADIPSSTIDLIIVATTTPYYLFPNTACYVQHKLNLSSKQIPAFDLNSACSGFIYALSVAQQYIRTENVKTVLVIGVDALTQLTDWTDRSTCVLFGDGAGACILQASKTPGILSVKIHADGQYGELLKSRSGIFGHLPPDYIHMEGGEVFKTAVTKLGEIAEQVLHESGLSCEALDWLVPHQANFRIIKATAKRLKLSMDKVILTVQNQGNTSAASVPLALDFGVRSGKIQRNQHILLEAFGAGFSWGAAAVRF